MKSFCFIMNPISGVGSKKDIPAIIYQQLKGYHVSIRHTEVKGHARQLAIEARRDGFDAVVAVGGDGTVNEIASVLVNTGFPVGIIPAGSGNGMARQLGLPLSISKSIAHLKNAKPIDADAGLMGQHHFFITAGVGFDAHIAHLFHEGTGRGLPKYIKQGIKGFFNFTPTTFNIELPNGEKINKAPLILTFANAMQYGNNAFIAPTAKINDNRLDMALLDTMGLFTALKTIPRIFNNTIDKSDRMRLEQFESIVVSSEKNKIKAHYDGEPTFLPNQFEVKVVPNAATWLV